jgi:hypothetical protein
MTDVEKFFAQYEKGANSFDADLIASEFTPSFMSADPNGVYCVQNDEAFRQAIPERKNFFDKIGFRTAAVLDIAETRLDERYTMAKVHWHMVFEKDGEAMDFKFYITYFLFDPGSGPKIVFYISHDDEQKVMQEAGLIPSDLTSKELSV